MRQKHSIFLSAHPGWRDQGSGWQRPRLPAGGDKVPLQDQNLSLHFEWQESERLPHSGAHTRGKTPKALPWKLPTCIKTILSCVIERVDSLQGYRVIEEPAPEGSEGEKVMFERQRAWCCSTTPEPAICGISRIWVVSMMRRQSIASRMLECLRWKEPSENTSAFAHASFFMFSFFFFLPIAGTTLRTAPTWARTRSPSPTPPPMGNCLRRITLERPSFWCIILSAGRTRPSPKPTQYDGRLQILSAMLTDTDAVSQVAFEYNGFFFFFNNLNTLVMTNIGFNLRMKTTKKCCWKRKCC